MHERYLQRSVRRTWRWLTGFQLVIVGLWVAWERMDITPVHIWSVAAALQAAIAVCLLVTTLRRMQRTAWPAQTVHFSDTELPTVTVAIPARNETDELQACLESLVTSDYPKLEIIVLDDCSQTRRTPEIIRGFAHDGVRFIPGEEPADIWLPKNQAYDRLADEASGDYIVFCGVDVRFSRTALRQIISTMLARKKQMMSILPERAPEVRAQYAALQAMRYLWELVPPRRLFRRPPVLSSCWVITKGALAQAGAFDAVRRSIVPEAHFARRTAAQDAYSFMRAGINPGVQSVKGAGEQHDTAVRMRYPQMHRRPENIFMLAMAELYVGLLPFVIALAGYWFGAGLIAIVLSGVAVLLLTATYGTVAYGTGLDNGPVTWLTLPVVVVYDLVLLHYSMWRYEFSEVQWKGRNICIPAMHVIPHLPAL